MTADIHTSLTTDECIQRLTDALAESRHITGSVEGTSFRLRRQRSLSLSAPKGASVVVPALSGAFIPLDSGTSLQYDPSQLQDSAPSVEWKRLLLVLVPLLVGGVLMLFLLDITSRRDWFLALAFPALLIMVLIARQAFTAYQAKVATRELVDFLHRLFEEPVA